MSAIHPFGWGRLMHWKNIILDATAPLNTLTDLLVPEDASTLVLPEVIWVYERRGAGTYQTSPVITFQDDLGNAIAGTLTVGTATNQGKFAPVRPTAATFVNALTGGRKLQAKVTTAGVGQVTASRLRLNNVATIVTGAAHGLLVGDKVNVLGMTDTSFNGKQVVLSVPTTTSFTFASVGANVTSAADTGGSVGIRDLVVHIFALYF